MTHFFSRPPVFPKINWRRSLAVLMLSILSLNAHAQDYTYGEFLKARSTSTLVSLGLITVTSALASQNAKATGIGMVALSPWVGMRAYSRRGARSGIVSMLGFAGLGWYNLDELAKNKYSKTRVFEKDMALMTGALAFGILLESTRYVLSAPPQKNFIIRPEPEGLSLNYSYEF